VVLEANPSAMTTGADGDSVVCSSVACTTCHAAKENKMAVATHATIAPNRIT
jgi:hypothetical protein